MTATNRISFTAALALTLAAGPAAAQVIALPNADFNDNSDGDLALVDGWIQSSTTEILQVDGAVGKDPGDLVVRLGEQVNFYNIEGVTGINFDDSVPGYKLTVETRAFASADFTDDSDATSGFWGMSIRDLTNEVNIKTGNIPNTLDTTWRDYSVYLTQEELASYASDNGIADINELALGVRVFKQAGAAAVIGIDNVVLELSAAPVPGDVDGNGLVELADYAIIRDNLDTAFGNRSSENLVFGDIYPYDNEGRIGDGVVDYGDFRFWKDEFLAAGGTLEQIAAFDAIPEPTAALLAVIGLALGAARVR